MFDSYVNQRDYVESLSTLRLVWGEPAFATQFAIFAVLSIVSKTAQSPGVTIANISIYIYIYIYICMG